MTSKAYTFHLSNKDRERFQQMAVIEAELRSTGYRTIAGVDEAGRGPLAGPVVAAACILDPAVPILGLNDSKRLSAARREHLFTQICKQALAYQLAFVGAAEIDEVNILNASKTAMLQAINNLPITPDMVLIDALRLEKLSLSQRAYIGGDAKVNAIAAASILAKVTRDRYMCELDQLYPEYGFASHKGYGTQAHYAAIASYGLTPHHRLSFLKKILPTGNANKTEDSVGFKAELAVAEHLRQQGYDIISHRYSLAHYSDIDLIALKNATIYFIEIKARSGVLAHEEARMAFTPRKAQRMRCLAEYFLAANKQENYGARLLLATCGLDKFGEVNTIKFFELDN